MFDTVPGVYFAVRGVLFRGGASIRAKSVAIASASRAAGPTNRQIGFRTCIKHMADARKPRNHAVLLFCQRTRAGVCIGGGRDFRRERAPERFLWPVFCRRLVPPARLAPPPPKNIPKEFPELDGGQCFPGASPVSWAPSDIATDTTKGVPAHAELHPASQTAAHHHQRRAYRRRPGRALRPTLAAGLRRGVHRRIDYRRAADPHPGGAGTARPGHVH